jgi:high-affinity iron transporter
VLFRSYIESKVKSAVTTGSAFALGAAAFLSVFREGAETILFYQALLSESENYISMVWFGFGIGCVALVFIFLLIRFGSLKLPLKPFFIGTSILMYLMCIAFAGGGIKELQEADVIGVTPVSFVQSVDILGIYPTVQTLLPQVLLVVLAAVSFIFYRKKSKKAVDAAI